MKVAFDTSVLVAAMVEELPDHERALQCVQSFFSDGSTCYCSTHAIAECYATLTALPLQERILPSEAAQLIKQNLVSRLEVLEIPQTDYVKAIDTVASLGFRSGMIYDALHLASAESANCEILFTFNLKHFQRLAPAKIKVAIP